MERHARTRCRKSLHEGWLGAGTWGWAGGTERPLEAAPLSQGGFYTWKMASDVTGLGGFRAARCSEPPAHTQDMAGGMELSGGRGWTVLLARLATCLHSAGHQGPALRVTQEGDGSASLRLIVPHPQKGRAYKPPSEALRHAWEGGSGPRQPPAQ